MACLAAWLVLTISAISGAPYGSRPAIYHAMRKIMVLDAALHTQEVSHHFGLLTHIVQLRQAQVGHAELTGRSAGTGLGQAISAGLQHENSMHSTMYSASKPASCATRADRPSYTPGQMMSSSVSSNTCRSFAAPGEWYVVSLETGAASGCGFGSGVGSGVVVVDWAMTVVVVVVPGGGCAGIGAVSLVASSFGDAVECVACGVAVCVASSLAAGIGTPIFLANNSNWSMSLRVGDGPGYSP